MSIRIHQRRIASYSFIVIASLGKIAPVYAAGACTTSASGNVLCTGGAITAPLTIYDAAAAFQPVAGSNSYVPANPAFPAATNPNNKGYNPNPATVFVTIDPTANFSVTTNATSALTDKGVIAANFSNSEDPAVNNVTVNNSGTISITTSQIATSRMHAIVGDSQVNLFTVNNAAGGTIAATQNFFGTTFNPANLKAISSNAAAPTPSTYSVQYNGATLNIISAMYSDDNTNSFVINNAGTITAAGNFSAAYYGRADTTVTNSGTIANTSWTKASTFSSGNWALVAFAGADFATVAGSNPDTPLYDVQKISLVNGVNTGTLAVLDTSALTVTNTKTGTITGDIVAVDTNPLVTAAAAAQGLTLPLASSGSNSGPRDSAITNAGTVNGNFYLGSGTHVIDNTGTINGSFNVDQRASTGTFAIGVAGTVAGTYASAGPATTSSTGAACPTANANTTDPYCAKTQNVLASFVGGQSFTLTNEGKLNGDIIITDQATSVNSIGLTGTGFSGNVIAKNGTGSNTLTLSGVTNLTSVQNFSTLDLTTSRVTVSNGVSLVKGANLKTTVSGAGGTAAAPSTNAGTIFGTLTLAGATTVTPTLAGIAHNGDTYVIASKVAGPGTVKAAAPGYLVTPTVSTASGALILTTSVIDPRTIAGLSASGGATLANLLSYAGAGAKTQALGAAVESIGTSAGVVAAGESLRPAANGNAIQVPVAIAGLFQNQIDSRLDGLLYAQLPSSGRSADLGPSRRVIAEPVRPDNAVWAGGIEGSISQGSTANVAGYTSSASGVIGGYDRVITPGIRVGGAFGYVETHTHDNTTLTNNTNLESYQGLAYAALEQANWYARGSIGYGGLNYNSLRSVAFAGFADTVTGNHKGNLLTGRVEGGVPVDFAGAIVVPYSSFTYARIAQNAYAETSANGAALAYQSATNTSDRLAIGAKSLIPIGTLPGLRTFVDGQSAIDVEIRAAYAREFGNVAQSATAGFVGGGNLFVATGPNPSRDMVDFGAGLNLSTSEAIFSLTYNAVARSTYLEQVGLFKARYVF